MTFQSTIWLYGTAGLVLFTWIILWIGLRKRESLLSQFAAPRLLGRLTEKASHQRTWIKAGCILLAVAGIGFALARPQYGVEWSERKARGLDIVFALDSSKSMLATDLRPTRLDRAKLAIIDLLERLESDRIGLVTFSGQAFLQTPPTLDYSAFRESLEAVDPSIMTSGGSDLGYAIDEASKAFPSEGNVKVVVLLTDGEDLGGRAIKAAEVAATNHIKIYSIGIGTPEGEYLKLRNKEGIEEFVRDASGKPVRSQLDENTLQQIAQLTGGSYSRLSSASLDTLYRSVLANLPREERESELQERRIERFQWPLSIALILLILDILIRRRRSPTIHAVLSMSLLALALPQPTQAEEVVDPITNYNSAHTALLAGDYDAALQAYKTAISLSEDFELQRDALYNMGHARHQQARSIYESGDPTAALEAIKEAENYFNSANEIASDDSELQKDLTQITQVREAIEQLLDQQQNPDQEQQEQNQDNSESEEAQQESEQNQDSQEQQDGSDSEESEDSEQSQDAQDQEGQEGNEQESSEDGDASEQEPSDENSQESLSDEAAEEPENGETSENKSADQESTDDPVDDIPVPDEESTEEASDPSEEVPQVGDDENGSNSQQATLSEPVEGISQQEAILLLDSLQNKEELLPFIEQRAPGKKREIKDW